jgi:hypothetical protein
MALSQYLIPLVLFIALASPMSFKTVRGVLGGWVASPEGQAKFLGLLVHGIIFVITVGYIMRRVSPYWSNYTKEHDVHQMEAGAYLNEKERSSPMKEQRFTLSGSPF